MRAAGGGGPGTVPPARGCAHWLGARTCMHASRALAMEAARALLKQRTCWAALVHPAQPSPPPLPLACPQERRVPPWRRAAADRRPGPPRAPVLGGWRQVRGGGPRGFIFTAAVGGVVACGAASTAAVAGVVACCTPRRPDRRPPRPPCSNNRVASWFIEDMPVHKAAFAAGGSKVGAGSMVAHGRFGHQGRR